MHMQPGDMVELKEATAFYPKGQLAVVVKNDARSPMLEIRYEGERYEGYDVDIVPKELFRDADVF